MVVVGFASLLHSSFTGYCRALLDVMVMPVLRINSNTFHSISTSCVEEFESALDLLEIQSNAPEDFFKF